MNRPALNIKGYQNSGEKQTQKEQRTWNNLSTYASVCKRMHVFLYMSQQASSTIKHPQAPVIGDHSASQESLSVCNYRWCGLCKQKSRTCACREGNPWNHGIKTQMLVTIVRRPVQAPDAMMRDLIVSSRQQLPYPPGPTLRPD